MVNKCQLEYCPTGKHSSTGDECGKNKVSTMKFLLHDAEVFEKWKYIVGKTSLQPTKYSVICEKHFDPRYIKIGKERNKLRHNLRPVPTIHMDDGSIPPSMLNVPTVPRPSPIPRNQPSDEKPSFIKMDKIESLACLSIENAPPGWSFRRHREGGDEKVVFYNLQFDYVTSIPIVFESIVVDSKLHVSLSYKGNHIPLPLWFRDNHCNNQCKLDRFSMLKNFPSHIRAKANETDDILEEMNEIKHLQPQGRPPYSAKVIRWAPFLRHTSPQAYRLLLEKLTLPSFSVLQKYQRGGLDVIKSITYLFQKNVC